MVTMQTRYLIALVRLLELIVKERRFSSYSPSLLTDKSNVGMESDIHLNISAPVVFLKFCRAGFLDLPSFARRMKSEKKSVGQNSGTPI